MRRATENEQADDAAAAGGGTAVRGHTVSGALRSCGAALRRRFRAGDLGSLPIVLVLATVWIVFQCLNGNFLSPRNLSNISVDIVGTGLIAVGIVFVLLLGELDLSVGSISGLAAAVFAVLNVNNGVPEWLALILAVLTGTAAGAVQGYSCARTRVPAFVLTLAGLLTWNGVMLAVLGTNGTVNLDEHGLVADLTDYYFTNDAVAYCLAAVCAGAVFTFSYLDRRRRTAAGMPHRTLRHIALRTGAIAVVAFVSAYLLNRFQGLPLALLIFLAVVAGLDVLLRHTHYGRQVYALGGGVEAARRASLNVIGIRTAVLAVSGTMAAIGGLFLASRITSVSQTSGSGVLLLNAIAAAVIGGTSLFGGRGTTWSAVLGMLVIQSISSGMAITDTPSAAQLVITGGVLFAAVVIDALSRRSQEARGRA
ncbi:sugar ABC transporter permease [Streptomyces spinosirectus]|jgi:D-xylose transport system permease protein|uniref:sugar ABC transporter permease n=1 Tax=Streptomyces TaxID=1883 RepID=UPI000D3DB9F6|nr:MULTISPECIES: ABC transporter permease [Streptomyces]MBY8341537.1 sugar ABC transporter permease [Streptomyces plumbidurans]PTM96675.1 D-xylose transport system permease protein [Streptomyces sp. VMFN-G11Ma]UIR16250.1 sugar ABC transporter permease [Streptomyces spinosirectus]